MVEHPFDPVFDEMSRILILGSFPSVRSRNDGFYQKFSLVPNLPYFILPSTSPLNARMSLSELSEK